LTSHLQIFFHQDLIRVIHHPKVSKGFQANLLILLQLFRIYGIALKIQLVRYKGKSQAKKKMVKFPPSFELAR